MGTQLVKVNATPLQVWAAANPSQPDAIAQLKGKVVRISERGCLPVHSVDRERGLLQAGEDGPRLDLTLALEQGRAVCLESQRDLGSIALLDKTPPRDGPLIIGMIASLLQNLRHTPKLMLRPRKLRLQLPEEMRAARPENYRYACEMALLAAAKEVEEVCEDLENAGYPAVRVIENDHARALVMVDPTERAIIVAFRPAMNLRLVSFGLDRKFVSRDSVRQPRGITNYVGRISDELGDTVKALAAKYPQAQIVVAGGSLGGGVAVQWVSSALADGTVDPDRIARLDAFAALGGVSRDRAAELRTILGDRFSVHLGNGDWLAGLLGARDYGASVNRVGDTKMPMTKAHALGTLLHHFSRQEIAARNA